MLLIPLSQNPAQADAENLHLQEYKAWLARECAGIPLEWVALGEAIFQEEAFLSDRQQRIEHYTREIAALKQSLAEKKRRIQEFELCLQRLEALHLQAARVHDKATRCERQVIMGTNPGEQHELSSELEHIRQKYQSLMSELGIAPVEEE